MKVEVIVCDRCEARITEPEQRAAPDLGELTIRRRDAVRKRDLCVGCLGGLDDFLGGMPLIEPREAPVSTGEVAEELLGRVRATANHALERYAEGAGPHELAADLRDVATGARR